MSHFIRSVSRDESRGEEDTPGQSKGERVRVRATLLAECRLEGRAAAIRKRRRCVRDVDTIPAPKEPTEPVHDRVLLPSSCSPLAAAFGCCWLAAAGLGWEAGGGACLETSTVRGGMVGCSVADCSAWLS